MDVREPVAISIGIACLPGANRMDVTWIPAADHASQRGLLARSDPAFEEDDDPPPVDDLAELRLGEPHAQRPQGRRGVSSEWRPPFKSR